MKYTASLIAATALVAGCASQPAATGTSHYANLKTLDGKPPLIIGHRGLAGLYPEEVIAGYQADRKSVV